MALTKMTVGIKEGEEVTLAIAEPYQFYAYPGTGTDMSTKVVNLVMPFGGRETGFYRYPKAGEKIVVDDDGAANKTYYLIGYLPSETDKNNNFLTHTSSEKGFDAEKAALKEQEGMILRYAQTGKTKPSEEDPSDRYSEIGFYRRKTQWVSEDTNYKDVPLFPKQSAEETEEAFSARLVAAGYPKNDQENAETHIKRVMKRMTPRIDRLNIQSTGDIHTQAKSHHRMKAKRIEILSDVPEKDFSWPLEYHNRPFGDKGADVSDLFQGDIHIRGKRRIILKAGNEIRLEVGRSTIVISDAGIILTSRKTHSDIHNNFDTTLSVLPRDGISMFGQHLKLSAAYDWAIGENMGSSIKGTAGIMRLLGKDIKASTFSGVAYIVNFISQTLAFGANLTSMSMGTHDSDNVQTASLPSVAGMGAGVAGIVTNVGIGMAFPDPGEAIDPDSSIVKYVALALSMMGTVVGVIETIYISPEDKKAKDDLALAGLIAEWGCVLAILIDICVASLGIGLLFTDSIHLDSNYGIFMISHVIKQFSIEYEKVNTPLAGLGVPPKDDRSLGQKILDFLREKWYLFLLLPLIGSGGSVAAVATLSRMTDLTSKNEELFKELNAL
ncbi:MAG: hypothetical protein LBP88_02810 [Treponema sp.]|jgi:hypothetical protein|nr:hypothetical protein [Treponema sp.]